MTPEHLLHQQRVARRFVRLCMALAAAALIADLLLR